MAAPRTRLRPGPILRFALGLVVLGWLAFSGAIDWTALTRLQQSADLLAAAAALVLLNFVFMAGRLWVLLAAQGLPVGPHAAFQLTTIAAFFSSCIPGATGGDLVKLYLLRRAAGGRFTESVVITLWDRCVGFITWLAWAVVTASAVRWPAAPSAVVRALSGGCALLLVAVVACLVLALGRDWTRLSRVQAFARRGRLGRTLCDVLRIVHGFRRRPAALGAAFLFSMLSQACQIMACWIIATAVIAGPVDGGLLPVVPLGFVANALPLTPGGLGVGEAAFEELFNLMGYPGGADTALALRVVAVALSLIGAGYYLLNCGNGFQPTADPEGNASSDRASARRAGSAARNRILHRRPARASRPRPRRGSRPLSPARGRG
jgi:uncharacterized protein (TIRG00374 family)